MSRVCMCEQCGLMYPADTEGEPSTHTPSTCDDCGGYVMSEAETRALEGDN